LFKSCASRDRNPFVEETDRHLGAPRSRASAALRRSHRLQVEVVAGDHLHALVFQPLRAAVDAVDEGRELVAFFAVIARSCTRRCHPSRR
jgi:hypothetical protein